MIQVFFLLVRLLAIGVFAIATILALRMIFVRREQQQSTTLYTVLTLVFGTLTLLLWNWDMTSSESGDLEDTAGAFQSNFGFPPPASVGEIKVKNFYLHDAHIHWMRFTYDQATFSAILRHDAPLDTALTGTDKYREAMLDLRESMTNAPGWWTLPSPGARRIFVKENFLNHSYSSYYLWSDTVSRLSYLQVHYFD